MRWKIRMDMAPRLWIQFYEIPQRARKKHLDLLYEFRKLSKLGYYTRYSDKAKAWRPKDRGLIHDVVRIVFLLQASRPASEAARGVKVNTQCHVASRLKTCVAALPPAHMPSQHVEEQLYLLLYTEVVLIRRNLAVPIAIKLVIPPVLHILRSTCSTYMCSPSLAFVQVFCPIGLSSTIIKQGRYISKFCTLIIVNLPVLLFWYECCTTQENTTAQFIALSQSTRLVNAVSDKISRDYLIQTWIFKRPVSTQLVDAITGKI